MGLVLGLGRPLLPLAMIAVLIVVSIAVVWTVAGTVRARGQHGPYQAVVGLAVIYLAMTIVAEDLLWAPRMFMGAVPGKVAVALILGSGAAIGGHYLNLVSAGWIYLTDFLVWLRTLLLVPIL
ncbi:MAG: hypothetical protein VCE75_03540 [Alphaproteobacteria bacterium]